MIFEIAVKTVHIESGHSNNKLLPLFVISYALIVFRAAATVLMNGKHVKEIRL